jgi:hypothetical protein
VINGLNEHHEATKYWSEEGLRVISHVAHSPSIDVGVAAERFAEARPL